MCRNGFPRGQRRLAISASNLGGTFDFRQTARRAGDLIRHRFGGNVECNHAMRAHGRIAEPSSRRQRSEGAIAMPDARMLSLAASIMLGMWLIWKITP
jgi:hypothetical protein